MSNNNTTDTPTNTTTEPTFVYTPAKDKNLKAIIVNLDQDTAELFYDMAKSGKYFNKKNPTAVARELIRKFIADNK